jgi:transposase
MTATAEPLTIEFLGASLTEQQAREIFRQGEEAAVFALLELAKQLRQAQGTSTLSPSTPSGMKPPYQKATTKQRRKKSGGPGRKAGHVGSRRKPPEHIDQTKEHRLEHCPDCGGELKRCQQTRTRYTEDIPQNITPVVTEHVIHRDYCAHCHKHVEPTVPDALGRATLGNHVLVLSAWLHYGLGNTLGQIVEVFNAHLQFELSPGGLINMWHRLAAILYAWYEQIQREALNSAVLHGDETGWRVKGETYWLWCFCTQNLTYYMIDRSRGSPALLKFFTETFAGTLISDFWGAYNAVHAGQRQMCLVHLLRDLEKVEQYGKPDQDWAAFAKKLRRLLRDAMRLWKRDGQLSGEPGVASDEYDSKRNRLHQRLAELIETDWQHKDARRLIKRLRRHQQDLFTFLDFPDVPFDNNHAERAIRPAVIMRKNSYSNRSERGADTQAVLMSIYRTLKQRGHHPIKTIVKALETYLKTNQLPPLPAKITADG